MIRKIINETNIKKAMLVILIVTQVYALFLNSFKFYPNLQLNTLVQGVFIYGPFLLLYIYCIRSVGLTLFRSTTQSSTLDFKKLIQGLSNPKLLFLPLFMLLQPYYNTFALTLIEKMHSAFKLNMNVTTRNMFSTALTQTTNLAWILLMLVITTVVGYIGFNLYTQQLAKFKFIKKQLIRPLDDLISLVPFTSIIYFLYLIAI